MERGKTLDPTDLLRSERLDRYLLITNPSAPLALLLKGNITEFEDEAIPICMLNDGNRVKVGMLDRDLSLLELIISNFNTVLVKDKVEYKIKNIFELLEVF